MPTLGLPLEYQQRPEWFDAHNIGAETEAKNALIASLLEKYQAKRILDLTCGTGSQVFYLAERGFEITGADFSPALLEIARARAAEASKPLNFIDGDMRSLHVGEYDAVITIFNAIGHLTPPDFATALANIHRNLKPGGIYIFDIFNLAAISDALIDSFAMEISKTVNGKKLHNTQRSTLDREQGLLTSYDHYLIDGKEELTNQFSLQIYTPETLDALLTANGFACIERCGMDGKAFSREETVSMVTVARKN
jgi:ubiquinone/menaquinone biosynthesis C-methylase UbiE